MAEQENKVLEQSTFTKDSIDRNYQIVQKYSLIEKSVADTIKPFYNPKLYGFLDSELNELNQFSAVKIGDTMRETVDERLAEWVKKGYLGLSKILEEYCYIDYENERYYFRDYLIHKILRDMGYQQSDSNNPYFDNVKLPKTVEKLSREFFVSPVGKPITQELINMIIEDIRESVENGNTKYALSTINRGNKSDKIDYTKMSELDFSPYAYQKKAIDELTKILINIQDTDDKRALLDSPTRSGKTSVILWTILEFFKQYIHKQIDKSNNEKLAIVITTAIVDVLPEFKEHIQRHKDFKNIKWLDKEEIRSKMALGINAIDEAHETHDIVITGISLQDLSGRIITENSENDLKYIHKALENKVSFVVGDECHIGMFGYGEKYKEALQVNSLNNIDTNNIVVDNEICDEEISELTKIEKIENNILNDGARAAFSLNPKYGFLFSSATTYNIVGSRMFKPSQIYFISQNDVDDQAVQSLSKAMFDYGDESKSPFFGKPHRFNFALSLGTNLTVSELYKANSVEFIYKEAAHSTMDALFGLGNNKNVPALLADEVLKAAGAGRHMLIQLPSKRSCDAMEKYFKERNAEYPEIFGYHILNISSHSDNGYSSKSIEFIKREIDKFSFGKTVTITVNRGVTGVSVRQWDTVLLCNIGKSLNSRVQTYGSPNTPYVEVIDYEDENGNSYSEKVCLKPNSFVIDFSGEQMYEIANDIEIHHGHLKNEGINTAKDSKNIDKDNIEKDSLNDDNSLLGRVFSFNGVSLYEVKRQDIHKRLKDYMMNRRVSDIISDIPTDDNVVKKMLYSQYDSSIDFVNVKQCKKGKLQVKLTDESEKIADRLFDLPITGGEDKTSDVHNDINNSDNVDESSGNDSKSSEEYRREKAIAFLKFIEEKAMLFAIIHGDVESLNDIVSIMENIDKYVNNALIDGADVNDSIFNVVQNSMVEDNYRMLKNIGLGLNYLNILKDLNKNYRIVDRFERGVKSIRARCFDADGNFYAAGYQEVLNGLSRFSNNEVITPVPVADLLLDKLLMSVDKDKQVAESFMSNVIVNGGSFIDVGCKSGIILSRFAEFLKNNGVDDFFIKNSLFAIPTSPVAFEFVRKLFVENGWNVDDILFVDGVSNVDMLKLVEYALELNNPSGKCLRNKPDNCEIHGKKISTDKRFVNLSMSERINLLVNNIFVKIVDKDVRARAVSYWEFLMDEIVDKFDFCVSNPPYQINIGRSHWIYTDFINIGNSVSSYSAFITPSSFLNTLDTTQGIDISLRHDKTLKQVELFNVQDVFDNVSVNGIAISLFDSHFDNEGSYIEIDEKKNVKNKKPVLKELDRLPEFLFSILKKIEQYNGVGHRISGRNPWDKNHLMDKNKTMYKVAFKEKNVTATHASKIYSPGNSPDVKEQHKFLAVYFDTEIEAVNFLNYQKTSFYQTLVKNNTYSHAGGAKIHNIVPDLEDYSNDNPIFQTDEELGKDHEYYGLTLDERLYKLFDLTEEEIRIVENNSSGS